MSTYLLTTVACFLQLDIQCPWSMDFWMPSIHFEGEQRNLLSFETYKSANNTLLKIKRLSQGNLNYKQTKIINLLFKYTLKLWKKPKTVNKQELTQTFLHSCL